MVARSSCSPPWRIGPGRQRWRLGEPARVAQQHRHHARRDRRAQRRAEREPAGTAAGPRRDRPPASTARRAASARPRAARVRPRTTVASSVTLVWPRTGRSPSRQITVSPSRVTSALIRQIVSASGIAQSRLRRSSRPTPASAPAARIAAPARRARSAGSAAIERRQPERSAPGDRDGSAGRVQRARSAPVDLMSRRDRDRDDGAAARPRPRSGGRSLAAVNACAAAVTPAAIGAGHKPGRLAE